MSTPRLHDYQRVAANFMIDDPRAGLLLEPGLGKTLTTIVALDALRLLGEVDRVLLVAPLRVARDVWPAELAKWSSMHDFTHAVAVGPVARRRAALAARADITVANVDTLVWLLDQYGEDGLPFDTLVIDELSIFKSHASQRFKALRRHLPKFRHIYGLTGTPAPNSLLDLWAQAYVIDQGESLFKRIGQYRDTFFEPDKRNGHITFSWRLKPGADEAIYERIAPHFLSMRAADHLDLPARTDNIVELHLSKAQAKDYATFKRDQVLALPDGVLTAQNAAVLANKLAQYTSGAVYDEDGETRHVNDLKLDAVRDIVEGLQGSPVIIFYGYQHERDRLLATLPGAELYGEDTMERWNRGDVPVLLLHPKSAGHGLNLQHGGHTVVWASLPWSLELYQQANARLDRQGQTHPVVVHHLVVSGTVDERILAVLQGKAQGQDALMDAMRAEVANVHP